MFECVTEILKPLYPIPVFLYIVWFQKRPVSPKDGSTFEYVFFLFKENKETQIKFFLVFIILGKLLSSSCCLHNSLTEGLWTQPPFLNYNTSLL